jgi:hypothetical protein
MAVSTWGNDRNEVFCPSISGSVLWFVMIGSFTGVATSAFVVMVSEFALL